MLSDKALRKQVSLEICGVYIPFAIIFIILLIFLIHMEFIASRFLFLGLLSIFWSIPGLKKLTKYVGNFENSHFFAGEQNILNPKISCHTKTNLKINQYYVMLNPMKYSIRYQ